MIATFVILISLVTLIPALMVIEGILATGMVSVVVAVATLVVVFTLHPRDLNRFSRLLRPSAVVVLFIPCLWMLLQVLPVPARSLANPVWASASAALDKPLVGAVSLDIGATLLSLARYCTVLAAAFITATVTLDRRRAERFLSLLTAITALIAAALISFDLGYVDLFSVANFGGHAEAKDIAVIGLVLSCATTINAYEQLDVQTAKHSKSHVMPIVAVSVSLVALFICLSAVLISADAVLFFASLFGSSVLISVLAIRRWRLGPWGQAGIAVIAAVAIAGFFAVVPAKKEADPTFALSTEGQIASLERMLSDVKWTGSGAGSFESLLPIYRGIDEAAAPAIPTAATTIAIEMGRPFLWACVIVVSIGASTLFRRALLRGRDHVYSSAGAGCMVALSILLFANGGVLGLAASLAISVLCGLAFAQSQSNRVLSELYDIANGTYNTASTGFAMSPNSSAKTWLRVALALFGLVLTMQAAWILLPIEKYPLSHMRLPVDQKTSTITRSEQDRINQAASSAVVRGDLWAESAFTYAGQLWIDLAMAPDNDDQLNAATLRSLTRALRYSPHRGDVWLLFAALADRSKMLGYQPSLLLKMSYYTAPNELALFPLRLNVSLHAKGVIGDAELEDMLRRNISLILTRAPALKPTLLAAYGSASPQGKAFAERVIAEVDPGYLSNVRAAYP